MKTTPYHVLLFIILSSAFFMTTTAPLAYAGFAGADHDHSLVPRGALNGNVASTNTGGVSAREGRSQLGRVEKEEETVGPVDTGFATVHEYQYEPMSFSSSRLRVRRGEYVEMSWNTGGRVMCAIHTDTDFRYPKMSFFEKLFGPQTYVPTTGATTVEIKKEQTFTLLCEDPGIDGNERGADMRVQRIRLVPFYPQF